MSVPDWNTADLAAADKNHVWHPFTAMLPWCAPEHEPLFLTRGEGVWLWDSRGRKYLDGNSSIWTNIHGHKHPKLVAALSTQAATVAHTSFLGFSNPWAVTLASRLCGFFPKSRLNKVFFTDDGSTAIECAVKMAIQYRQLCGQPERVGFAAFTNAYHGDTLGAASLGGVSAFCERFARWGMQPLRVSTLEDLERLPQCEIQKLTAVIIEPMVQGVNRFALWPQGMLAGLRAWCDAHDVLLILDEVMTGFGRTGRMFACQHEDVIPDFLCLAKGITGGTLPLAATLVSDTVYEGFLGTAEHPETFFYGHSYCGNPLGCAVALASLDIFAEENVIEHLPPKIAAMARGLEQLQQRFPRHIAATRQLGMIGAVDVVSAPGVPWPAAQQMGAVICRAARAHGLLTRPVLDTLVIMPPLSISIAEIDFLFSALAAGLEDTMQAQPA